MKHLWTAAEAALVIVATLLIFIPELRTTPMRLLLGALWAAISGLHVLRLYRAGTLNMTPRQIYQASARPKLAALSFVAILTGSVAIVLTAG